MERNTLLSKSTKFWVEQQLKDPDIIDDLYFKYFLNQSLRRGSTFEDLFHQEGFATSFSGFLKRRIGQIWLKSENGQKFGHWQEGT